MDRKQTSPVVLITFLSISICTAFRYQTFIPKPKTEPDYIISSTLSIQLIHRDEHSRLSRQALLYHRLRRDHHRVQALTARAAASAASTQSDNIRSDVSSGLALGSGEYFALLGVGTPPNYLYMSLDTGSDVVWLQCTPCVACYTQLGPVFDPTRSSSFSPVSCGSNFDCQEFQGPGCNAQGMCAYLVMYGDGSITQGQFSNETLTFGESRVKNVSLGCGHDNKGIFSGSAGLLGLGRGKLSFPVQTWGRFGGIFSYCLVDRNSAVKSSILFGQSSVWRNTAFTPLLEGTHYNVKLIGISVGGVLVTGINSSVFGPEGVIIDSGTAITRLVEPAYSDLRDAFRAGVRGMKLTSGFSVFDTCYDHPGAQPNLTVPIVELHFDGGANMSLQAKNYLVKVDEYGTLCFAFASGLSGLSIIGNLQQQGFGVVYDLQASRIGFAPNTC